MIFARLALIALLASMVGAFQPTRVARSSSQVQMKADTPSAAKLFGAALVASTMFSIPAFAKDNAGAKLSFFGDDSYSSPFTVNEAREDPIYSPYSAYGDGSASVYKKANKDELSFYTTVLKNSA